MDASVAGNAKDETVLGFPFENIRIDKASPKINRGVSFCELDSLLHFEKASRLSGEWSDDDYDVLADGVVVGRIMKAMAAPEGTPGYGTLAHGHRDDRT